MVHRREPTHDEYKVKLKIRLNDNRMIEMENAQLIEQYTEEVEEVIKKEPKKKEEKVKEEKPKDEKKDEKKSD